MDDYFTDPFDAYQRVLRRRPAEIPGDPYGGPTPDLDDLPLPDVDGLDRRAEARVAEVFGGAA
jgi:hypothetical protein